MAKGTARSSRIRDKALSEFQRKLALEKFQEERPQLWLQSQRLRKLVDIQDKLAARHFAAGSCFLHANTVSFSSFCIKRVIGVDLDTCQATIEIYGDEHLEAGVVMIPLEVIEWFGFPTTAVSTGIHFEGFEGAMLKAPSAATAPAPPAAIAAPPAKGKGKVKPKPDE
jgi:hypothetical protein